LKKIATLIFCLCLSSFTKESFGAEYDLESTNAYDIAINKDLEMPSDLSFDANELRRKLNKAKSKKPNEFIPDEFISELKEMLNDNLLNESSWSESQKSDLLNILLDYTEFIYSKSTYTSEHDYIISTKTINFINKNNINKKSIDPYKLGVLYASLVYSSYSLGNYQNVLEYTDAYLTLSGYPKKETQFTPSVIYYRMKVFLKYKDSSRAFNVVSYYLKHYPKSLGALDNIADYYFDTKDFQKAIESREKIIAYYPSNISAYVDLSDLHGDIANRLLDEAFQFSDKAFKVSRRSKDWKLNWDKFNFLTDLSKKHRKNQIKTLTTAIKKVNGNHDLLRKYNLYPERAFVYSLLNQYTDSINDYINAVKIEDKEPNKIKYYSKIAENYEKMKKYYDSIKYYLQAISLGRKYKDEYIYGLHYKFALSGLIFVYKSINIHKESEKYIVELCEFDPSYPRCVSS
jgi:tetratricopeptide (TPR) repeat protein